MVLRVVVVEGVAVDSVRGKGSAGTAVGTGCDEGGETAVGRVGVGETSVVSFASSCASCSSIRLCPGFCMSSICSKSLVQVNYVPNLQTERIFKKKKG